jgi:acyl-CoA synthetase (AMP-forming)/AMP-acid ligase II
MLSEYYQRPEETQKAFQDGWYLTGDMGYLVDGDLFITGRKKDLIIVGGKNIYPQDLEFLANRVEGVYPGRVAAFGVDNTQTGTQDVVILAEAANASKKQLQDRQQLANAIRTKVTQGSDVALRYVYIVDRGWLIKTSSGKVSRSANKEKYLSEFYGNNTGLQAGSNS